MVKTTFSEVILKVNVKIYDENGIDICSTRVKYPVGYHSYLWEGKWNSIPLCPTLQLTFKLWYFNIIFHKYYGILSIRMRNPGEQRISSVLFTTVFLVHRVSSKYCESTNYFRDYEKNYYGNITFAYPQPYPHFGVSTRAQLFPGLHLHLPLPSNLSCWVYQQPKKCSLTVLIPHGSPLTLKNPVEKSKDESEATIFLGTLQNAQD